MIVVKQNNMSHLSIGYKSSSDDDDNDSDLGTLTCKSPCNEANLHGDDDSKYYVKDKGNDRSLDWPTKGFKPHPKSDPFKKDSDLIGEAVYGREGKPLEGNVAEFGLKEPKQLDCHAGKCKPDTQHARLHKELYGKCPEDESGLVATGFAYKKQEGEFAFNSNTFNDNRKPYLDSMKYKTEPTRTAGPHAQMALKDALTQWKEDNCPKGNWSFNPK